VPFWQVFPLPRFPITSQHPADTCQVGKEILIANYLRGRCLSLGPHELVKPDQFALWFTIISKNLIDVALLLDSGGKSLHAWIRVNLPDRAAWETEVGKRIYGPQGVFSCMGADRACRNPSRLSRLPGHYRAEKANWQSLLYVNPVKEGTTNDPIWEV
jgi:hypothetical protein